MKIISGGQTGVDQVGLFVARELGIETGGTAPNGWRTDEGPAPWLADYGLIECQFAGYRVRTIQNVRDADGTVWFGERSPGYFCTIGAAIKFHMVHVINPTVEILRHFLADAEIETLNVAGNRLRTHPEASERARVVLREVLNHYASALQT